MFQIALSINHVRNTVQNYNSEIVGSNIAPRYLMNRVPGFLMIKVGKIIERKDDEILTESLQNPRRMLKI